MITLMSSWSAEYQPLADITWANKRAYAARHGYQTHHMVHAPGIGIMKDRMVLWLDALHRLDENDWLFFTGSDALISRRDIPVDRFIGGDFDFVCCLSHDVVFGDVWFMRSNSRTKYLLERMIGAFNGERSEQELFAQELCLHTWHEYQRLVPQNWGEESCYAGCEILLNATDVKTRVVRPHEKLTGDDPSLWPGNIPPYHWWSKDHLVYHMGGMSLPFRLANIGKYVQV